MKTQSIKQIDKILTKLAQIKKDQGVMSAYIDEHLTAEFDEKRMLIQDMKELQQQLNSVSDAALDARSLISKM